MLDNIDNTQQLIDSQEVVAEIEYLEGLVEENRITRDEMRDLDTLRALESKGEEYAKDWQYGAILIRFDYFTAYIEQMIRDTDGEALENMPRLFRDALDWHKIAEQCMDDYSEIDYEGVTYYVRKS